MDEAESAQDVGMRRLIKDFKVVVQDAENLFKATADDLGERAKESRARLAASLDAARGSLDKLEDKALAGARATDQVIRDHPYQSLGVVLGVGLLLGVLLARK